MAKKSCWRYTRNSIISCTYLEHEASVDDIHLRKSLRILGLVDFDELLEGAAELLTEVGETKVFQVEDNDVLVDRTANALGETHLEVVEPLHGLDVHGSVLIHVETIESLGINLTGTVDVDNMAILGHAVETRGPDLGEELATAGEISRSKLVDIHILGPSEILVNDVESRLHRVCFVHIGTRVANEEHLIEISFADLITTSCVKLIEILNEIETNRVHVYTNQRLL